MYDKHMEFQNTAEKEWISRRIDAVSKKYNAFNALTDHGIELVDESTSLQLFCPFHDNKNTPAARYYASSGQSESHFYCFKCKQRLNGIAIYARFNNIKFIEALSRLERKYGISVPKIDLTIPIEPSNRDYTYKSSARNDIPRMLEIANSKLIRGRDKCSYTEFIGFCLRIDDVAHRFNVVGAGDDDMANDLGSVMSALDDVLIRPEDPLDF